MVVIVHKTAVVGILAALVHVLAGTNVARLVQPQRPVHLLETEYVLVMLRPDRVIRAGRAENMPVIN